MFYPLENLKDFNIILASGSPRRRELLELLSIDFTVDTSVKVTESYPSDLPIDQVAPYLSQLKARAHRQLLKPKDLVITADTVVILGDQVIGKPKSMNHAREMLHDLSGQTHRVVTGVTIGTKDFENTFSATSEVEFAPLTDQEIDYYVRTFTPLDKAGAYGIQEWIGAAGIRKINGSFYNVMGLPVHLLYQKLKDLHPQT